MRRSRRQFLGSSAALGASLALGACALPRSGDRPLDETGSRLIVVNWSEYIDPELLPVIESDLRLAVDYQETYEDNQTSLDTIIAPALSAGRVPPYDLIVPTNWLAARMIANGWVEPIPLEAVPNHVNIDPVYLTNDWDRGSRFQMPWQAGITGIAYDPAQTNGPIYSIGQLFDRSLAGRVALIGEMREAVGFGMLLNGDDPSRPTPLTARAGFDVIANAVSQGQIAAIVFNEFADGLADGTFAASMAWSGDTVLLQADRPDIEFVIPDEGAISWFDTMVIPKRAPNYANAAAWMNWAYEPANAAQITSWVQYISPVLGVQDELRRLGGETAELAENPILFPDDETRNRLFTWGSLDIESELQLEDDFNALVESMS
ncbi:MAG: extracellular solute-binding protein [Acidimicrobiia bacterium]|nr:extracellular solute-binding protein [Acidimicrobiia bacterium]